ncbi:MAG TPA: flagellar export chaperone FliS [Bryobacteraceae bacterium]|nr:flagellar export chaperone FliS [Bryobacteraceae bacterium]
MWKSVQEAYLEERVLSAEPLELVRLLYRAAIAAVREARRALKEGEIAARSRAISKACGIVIELNASLDHSRGGDLSARLAGLYDYLLNRLLQANFEQSDAQLAEVLGLLSTLAEGWEQARMAPELATAGSAWAVEAELAAIKSHAWSV